MENEKILVPEEGAENTEQTVEKTEKTYTEAEFNAKLDEVLGKKIARNEAKLRKEYDRKYGELESVLRAGMGKEDIGEITEDLGKFYESKGIKIEKKPQYSAKDIEALAEADANEIIGYGDDEVAEEVDRLARIGADKMSARDKAVFKRLATHRQATDRSRELESIGVTEDVYNSKEFKEFESMFNSNVPITKIYEQYTKSKPQKEIRSAGSMQHNVTNNSGVKDYYTPEEIERLTEEDLDDPRVWEAVRRSMTGG